jgi:hypothetical protein
MFGFPSLSILHVEIFGYAHISFWVARTHVPKMAKNGSNSVSLTNSEIENDHFGFVTQSP